MVLGCTGVDRENEAGAKAWGGTRCWVDVDRDWRSCYDGSGYVVGGGREGECRKPSLEDIYGIRQIGNLSCLDLGSGQELQQGGE